MVVYWVLATHPVKCVKSITYNELDLSSGDSSSGASLYEYRQAEKIELGIGYECFSYITIYPNNQRHSPYTMDSISILRCYRDERFGHKFK
ncbi:hypothetical protein JTB14_032842 [Gonioctena quinquepunctata]|nr:hypothetical protein JTB14_032842 [Gonioctena quinquepunctata]